MYQILGVHLMIRRKSDSFPVIVRTYTVAYLQNFGCNTNHKYEKDIDYNYDIVALYRKIKFENLYTSLRLFQEVNIIIDV